jgi:hypothetical protein
MGVINHIVLFCGLSTVGGWNVVLQMATIAMARTLGIVASHVPTAEVVTTKVKFLWDALMALPVF